MAAGAPRRFYSQTSQLFINRIAMPSPKRAAKKSSSPKRSGKTTSAQALGGDGGDDTSFSTRHSDANYTKVVMDQWLNCTGRFNIPSKLALDTWSTMTQLYLENTRFYHTMKHIKELLDHFKVVETTAAPADQFEQPYAVLLMIFFHDIVYDPTKKDNEERSAEMFRSFCAAADGAIPPSLEALVVEGILQTKHHMNCAAGAHHDIQAFLDMDIAILGSNKERYMEYMRQIRQEYRHFPHDVYGKGRAAVLQTFLNTKRLYKTQFFYDLYEVRARDNLRYEISVLQTPEMASSRLTISDVAEVMQFFEQHYRANVKRRSFSHCGGDPLRLSFADVLHAVTHNMDMCLAYRDSKTKAITCAVICTRSTSPNYTLECRQEHDLTGKHAMLHCIVTHRERRGRGLASALLAELLVVLRECEVRKMSCLCWKGSRQQSFLSKQGFVPVGSEDDEEALNRQVLGDAADDSSEENEDCKEFNRSTTGSSSAAAAAANNLAALLPASILTVVPLREEARNRDSSLADSSAAPPPAATLARSGSFSGSMLGDALSPSSSALRLIEMTVDL